MNLWTLSRVVDRFRLSLLADVRRACSLLPSPNPGHNRPENVGRPILALRKASMSCTAAISLGLKYSILSRKNPVVASSSWFDYQVPGCAAQACYICEATCWPT